MASTTKKVPAKTNLSSLAGVITSGAHGRKFSTDEENLIIKMATDAINSGETVSVAKIRTAVGEMNTKNGEEVRTRAAVANAIERLAKAGKLSKSGIVSEGTGRTQYTEEEDKVLAKALMAAQKGGKTVTLPELHKVLLDSGVSPKLRSLPSVRAHVTNLTTEKPAPASATA